MNTISKITSWRDSKFTTRFILLFSISLICCLIQKPIVFIQAIEDTNVKVAFPIQKGFSELDKHGNYTGYTYDYLDDLNIIAKNELQNFFYQNAFQIEDLSFISYMKANSDQFILILLIIILIFALLFILYCNYNYKRRSQKIALEKQRYEQISELSNEFFFEYNIIDDQLILPEKSANFLGCLKEISLLRKDYLDILDFLPKEEMDIFTYIAQAQEGTEELLFHLPNHTLRWLRIISKIIFNEHGNPTYYIGKIVDIQEEKEQHNALLEKSKRDSLTQIYNAATSHELIADYIRTSTSTFAGTLFIIDIDFFKDINDTYGHYIGDYVLTEFAKILTTTFHKDDIIGRIGGDEFIVFIKKIVDSTFLEEKCELLRKKVNHIQNESSTYNITISIGATIAYSGQDYNKLYQTADQALYMVKNKGRNHYNIIY